MRVLQAYSLVLLLGAGVVAGAPLRGRVPADDAAKERNKDTYAHHRVKQFRTWEGEFVELGAQARRIETSDHCAMPWRGSSDHEALKGRYPLRADATQRTSDAALEGTFRARCIPHPSEQGAPLADFCLKEGSCDGDECEVTVAACPLLALRTPEAPRWAHSGSIAKVPELIKVYTSGEEGASRCLYAKSVDVEGKSKKHQVPVTRPCPSKGEKPADEWMWWLKPRSGLVGSAKFAKCLSLLPSASGARTHGALRLRSCHFMDTPIYQAFDLYKSSHTSHDQCEDTLPSQTSVMQLSELPSFFADITGLSAQAERARAALNDAKASVGAKLKSAKDAAAGKLKSARDAAEAKTGPVTKSIAKWIGKLKKLFAKTGVRPPPVVSAVTQTVASTDKVVKSADGVAQQVESAVDGAGDPIPSPVSDVQLDFGLAGSAIYGKAYGLPLNNEYYNLPADNNYRCNRLPLQAHANKRYGMVAVELPLTIKSPKFLSLRPKARAAATMCMMWNKCANSFAIELSSSLLFSLAAGPGAAEAGIQGGFGMGVSLSGELERAMDIPLWDGSRPEWVDPEFLLRDNGHFWFDYSVVLKAPGALGPLLRLELEGDLLINVRPRTYDDMTTVYRHFGDGVLLWNGHSDKQSNLLATLDAEALRKDAQKRTKCADEAACLAECEDICDKFNKHCHFISFYFDPDVGADSTKCNLYRTANTVKAKRRTQEELAELGYAKPAQLKSFFRDPKVLKSRLGDERKLNPEPTFSDADAEESESDPQSAINRYTGAGSGSDTAVQEATDQDWGETESGKSLLDALFTVSAIGKLTLALNLRKQTFGMVDLKVTLAAAVAIRAGRNIPNPGVYITLDLAGDFSKNGAIHESAVKDIISGPEGPYNQAASVGMQAKDHLKSTDPHAGEISIPQMSAKDISNEVTSGKASATAQFFFKDVGNFGFRTKTMRRQGTAEDGEIKSSFFEMKVVAGKFMVCYSQGNSPQPKCISSVLEILAEAGKLVVRLVRDFAGFVLVQLGHLVDGVLKLGENVAKAFEKGYEAAREKAAQVSKALVAGAEKVVEAGAEVLERGVQQAKVVITSVANFCTFGWLNRAVDFGTCCGGRTGGRTMPLQLFDHLIKYSYDWEKYDSNKYYWATFVQKYSPLDYSSYCLAPGTKIQVNGKEKPCAVGYCSDCTEGQICEKKSLSSYLCHDAPGNWNKETGELTFRLPPRTTMERQASFDAGTQCRKAFQLDVYTRAKEDFALAYYNHALDIKGGQAKFKSVFPYWEYYSGSMQWVWYMNYNYDRDEYAGLCTGSSGRRRNADACAWGMWRNTYCRANEFCEYKKAGNICWAVPKRFIKSRGKKSRYLEHYPDGIGF